MYEEKDQKSLMLLLFHFFHLSSADQGYCKYFFKCRELPPKFTIKQFPSGPIKPKKAVVDGKVYRVHFGL